MPGKLDSYALGTANKNLPTFVNIGRPSSPVQLTGGYLGAAYSATPFQPTGDPIPNLQLPKATTAVQREKQMHTLLEINKRFREDYAIESEIAARTKAYELAANMMVEAPAIVNFSSEPAHVTEMYGIGDKETDDFGRQLLLARRLAEKGVRFIQICHAGGGNGAWDAHDDMKNPRPALPRRRQTHFGTDPRFEAARHARQHSCGLYQRSAAPLVPKFDRARSQRKGIRVMARRWRRAGL